MIYIYIYRSCSLKQHSEGRFVAPLGYIITIPSQSHCSGSLILRTYRYCTSSKHQFFFFFCLCFDRRGYNPRSIALISTMVTTTTTDAVFVMHNRIGCIYRWLHSVTTLIGCLQKPINVTKGEYNVDLCQAKMVPCIHIYILLHVPMIIHCNIWESKCIYLHKLYYIRNDHLSFSINVNIVY